MDNPLLVSVLIGLLGASLAVGQNGSAENAHNQLSRLDWLVGSWTTETPSKITTEMWRKVSPLTFEGTTRTKSKATTDQTFVEHLRLIQTGADIFYLAKVAHNSYPIAFRLVTLTPEKAVFENPDHDFPQRITYHLHNPQTLQVDVEGSSKKFSLLFTKQ